jgi:hypothetical protein
MIASTSNGHQVFRSSTHQETSDPQSGLWSGPMHERLNWHITKYHFLLGQIGHVLRILLRCPEEVRNTLLRPTQARWPTRYGCTEDRLGASFMYSLSRRALQEVEILSFFRSVEVIYMSLSVPRRSSESLNPQLALQPWD